MAKPSQTHYFCGVVGARPQFIKASAFCRAVQQWSKDHGQALDFELIHTGQHYDASMSDVFFEEMAIPMPAQNLHVGSTTHGKQTGEMLTGLEAAFLKRRPEFVVVFGDTNSTLAAALAAAKLHIPVAHVEAGLRSFNKKMPEEQNRILVDSLSSVLFCPTSQAVQNLAREGFEVHNRIADTSMDQPAILNCGDLMYDCTRYYSANLADLDAWVAKNRPQEAFGLATIHRAENTDDPKRFEAILHALKAVSQKKPLLLPCHPRTRKIIEANPDYVALFDGARLQLLEPLPYRQLLALLVDATFLITDSGGLQKEAFFVGTPCITVRTETEWGETVDLGWNTLVEPKTEAFLAQLDKVFARSDMPPFAVRSRHANQPFGDGQAADHMVAFLAQIMTAKD